MSDDCEHEPFASDEGGPVFCRKCQAPLVYPSGRRADDTPTALLGVAPVDPADPPAVFDD